MFTTIGLTTLTVLKSVGSFAASSFLVYETGKLVDKGFETIGKTIGTTIRKVKKKKNEKLNGEPA